MSNFASLILYFCTFSASALLLYFGTKRSNKFLIALGILIPIVVGGFRFDVGTDYISYTVMYDKLADLPLSYFLSNNPDGIEIGFFGIIKMSELLTNSSEAMFVISAALTVIFTYLGLRRLNLKYPALSYFLFLMVLYPVTFNAVRQGIAIAICFYAFSFMIERRDKMFIFWLTVACLFHTSAIFMFPVYVLMRLLKSKQIFYNRRYLIKILFVSSMLIATMPILFNILLAFPMFEKYIVYGSSNSGVSNTTIAVKFAIIAGLLLLYKKLALKDKKVSVYFTLALLELSTVELWQTSYAIFRISLYLSFFSLILLANTVDVFSDKYGKYLMYTALISFGLLYFYIAYYIAGQADIMPYSFIGGK